MKGRSVKSFGDGDEDEMRMMIMMRKWTEDTSNNRGRDHARFLGKMGEALGNCGEVYVYGACYVKRAYHAWIWGYGDERSPANRRPETDRTNAE